MAKEKITLEESENSTTVSPTTKSPEGDLEGIANANTIAPSLQTRGSEDFDREEAMRLMAENRLGSIYMTPGRKWFSTKELAEAHTAEPEKVVTFKKE